MAPNIFEPEETVGEVWHRWVSRSTAPPRFPDAAIRFADIERRLGVFFRGLGGDPGIEIRAASEDSTAHRLSLAQRLGHGRVRIARASTDGDTLMLPIVLDCLDRRHLNRDLYAWLTAFAATSTGIFPERHADPLRQDLAYLRYAQAVTKRCLFRFPGLYPQYRRLQAAFLRLRPQRDLPPVEAALEACVRALLGDVEPDREAEPFHAAILDGAIPLDGFTAPKKYHPHMPLPLWGMASPRAEREAVERASDEAGETNASDEADQIAARRAKRQDSDQAERKDSLLLSRFEAILSLAEMLNINRTIDEEEDEENAARAAEDVDEIALVETAKTAKTKLKFDLDLAPADVDRERLAGIHVLPEWDYRAQAYLPDHCRILASPAEAADDAAAAPTDDGARRRVRAIRRRFEALRPKRVTLRAQLDGAELDMDALIRARCDLVATGEASNRIYAKVQDGARDLAVAVLVDTSRSTESKVEGRQVIDISREALTALSGGLTACGDDHAIFGFSSLKRDRVFIGTVKDFDEPLGPSVLARIAALKPGFYTRLGAAIRHVSSALADRPNAKKLLLVITDGKPNDLDHYEGRYGVEDCAKAIREARSRGLAVFGVTIDAKAQTYFPYVFGHGAYAIVSHAEKLPKALPLLFRQLVA